MVRWHQNVGTQVVAVPTRVLCLEGVDSVSCAVDRNFTTAQCSCDTRTRRVPQVRGGNLGLGCFPLFALKHPWEAAASLRQSNTPSYSTPNPSDDLPSRVLPDWRACNSAFLSSFPCYTH